MVYSIINTMNHFSSAKNIGLLWSILTDELLLDSSDSNNNLLRKVRTIFDANVSIFGIKFHEIKSLVELNKMFLQQVVVAVRRLIPNFNEERSAKKISISTDEPIGSPYKVEDIQRANQDAMSMQFNQRRAEFDALMATSKPTNIDFLNVGQDDDKLAVTDMDMMIAEKTAERNTVVNEPKRVSFEEPKKDKYAEQKSLPLPLPEITTSDEPKYLQQNTRLSIVPSNEIKEQLSIVNNKIAILETNMQRIIDLLEKPASSLGVSDMATQTEEADLCNE